MPKLNGTHLPSRLAERLADLQAGKEVAARDLKALLNDEQIAAMDAAWAEQQAFAQKKSNQAARPILTNYDANAMKVNGKLSSKSVEEYLEDACSGNDPIRHSSILDQTAVSV
jgi:hypothetical protein